MAALDAGYDVTASGATLAEIRWLAARRFQRVKLDG
jgi:hypothetical protein